MKKVAVIILSYDGLKFLPQLLGSLFDYNPLTVRQEVIVVDNHSDDGTVPWLKKEYSQVTLLVQPENLGFAAGNNIGFKYAAAKKFDYAMLLNQDTIVTAGYLDRLIKTAEASKATAAVQARLMLYPQQDRINSLGNVIHYLGFGYTYGHQHRQIKLRFGDGRINYCSGAACLLKISVLNKVGFFDEDLFIYHEDLELGWRLKMFGFESVIEPAAVVYHQYEFSRSIKKFYFMERNRFIVMIQNYKLATLLLILPAVIVSELGLFVFAVKSGWWQEKLRVYFYFLSLAHWRRIIEQRRKVQQSRVSRDRTVIWDFSGIIEHQEVESRLMRCLNPCFNWYWQLVKRLIIW